MLQPDAYEPDYLWKNSNIVLPLANKENMTKYFVLLACQLIEIYVLAYMPLYFNVNIIQKTNHQKAVTSYL